MVDIGKKKNIYVTSHTWMFYSSLEALRDALASRAPMVASMAMRPCFSSTERLRLKASASPSLASPAGSQ